MFELIETLTSFTHKWKYVGVRVDRWCPLLNFYLEIYFTSILEVSTFRSDKTFYGAKQHRYALLGFQPYNDKYNAKRTNIVSLHKHGQLSQK